MAHVLKGVNPIRSVSRVAGVNINAKRARDRHLFPHKLSSLSAANAIEPWAEMQLRVVVVFCTMNNKIGFPIVL